MTQYEQENDFGRGGGEIDDKTMDKAVQEGEAARRNENTADESEQEGPGPWAKASSGDADEI